MIQVLRARGYRVTQPRRQVLAVLAKAQEPVSPYDIQKTLQRQGSYLNHVTIYRILNLFCLLNLAHKVLSLSGYVICTLGEEEGCHRFMICRECGALQEFADKTLCQEENKITGDLGFQGEQHVSEILGLCSNCRKRTTAVL